MGCCWSRCLPWCCCSCKSTPEEKLEKAQKHREKEKNRARKEQENEERNGMLKQAEIYIKKRYEVKKRLDDLGSRLQKYWLKIETKSGDGEEDRKKTYILSVSKFSQVCPLGNREAVLQKLDIVNSLFEELNKHPYIQEIKEITADRIEDMQSDIIIVIQKEFPQGSLRDVVNGLKKDEYMKNWSDKGGNQEFSDKFQHVAREYALQILQGMLFLKKIGFPYLGNIHLGNVFLDNDDKNHPEGICKISGHENALLGFRTSIYAEVVYHGYLEGIDVIMFGRILFELCTCVQLPHDEIFPTNEQMEEIKDDQLRQLVQYTFARSDTRMSHSLKQVLKKLEDMKWYQRSPSRNVMKNVEKRSITKEMRRMLESIKF